ncbi:unnamed protein product, partial [Brassica rapa subsp. narinosa]
KKLKNIYYYWCGALALIVCKVASPLVAAILLSIFKPICKSHSQELIRLILESWSFDVLWILFVIQYFILSLDNLLIFCFVVPVIWQNFWLVVCFYLVCFF